MKKVFEIFGYVVNFEFEITSLSNLPEVKVKKLASAKLQEINERNSKESKKISLIKVLRSVTVSKILIDGGLVTPADIRDEDTSFPYVSLSFAKEWIEANFTKEELTNNE